MGIHLKNDLYYEGSVSYKTLLKSAKFEIFCFTECRYAYCKHDNNNRALLFHKVQSFFRRSHFLWILLIAIFVRIFLKLILTCKRAQVNFLLSYFRNILGFLFINKHSTYRVICHCYFRCTVVV